MMRTLAFVLICLAGGAWAQEGGADRTPQIAEAEARLARAAAALDAVQAEDASLSALAKAIGTYDAEFEALRDAVRSAGQRAEALALDLAVRQAEIARLFAMVQAMERQPELQVLHPQGPVGAARTGAMLARLKPGVMEEVARIGGRLDEIAVARQVRDEGLAALGAARTSHDGARDRLSAAIAADAEPCCGAAGGPLADMLRESETLSELAAGIDDAMRGKRPALRPLLGGEPVAPAGDKAVPLAPPVPGEVLRGFEARDAAGVARPGIVLAAQAQAIVQAPAAGMIRYAGPFLDYRHVVVLEPRRDTLIVIAGLAELAVRSGSVVEAGALLGMLGGEARRADDFVNAEAHVTETTRRETLYIEVRDRGSVVDPAQWFSGGGG